MIDAMSTALKQTTVDEFLIWAEGREERWELHDGVPVMISDLPMAMSPERLAHTRAKGTAIIALVDALKKTGLPCEAFTDGLAVKIDARTSFEPDASVACGPRRPEDTIVVSDLIIVVEVLSPNTAAIDHGRKLSGYFLLPSVQHY
jgi:Uma2 family endonuclease